MAIEKDQKKFFDEYAASHQNRAPLSDFFYELAAAELRAGFRWLSGCTSVLDYGCGTGDTIALFLSTVDHPPERIVGIDLSEVSIQMARQRHPFEFHVVADNDLSFLPAGSLDAAYMSGVLHHTQEHQKIFEQIARALRPGGRFLIVDLTRNNPIIESARALFPYMPKRIKQMFPDDLVIDETIPEKLRVEVEETLAVLGKAGFSIEHVEFGHLVYFVFDWVERITRLNLSKTRFNLIYKCWYRFEKWLLTMRPFKARAHLFALRAVKAA
jgi:SAM-dependent methyltransferase